MRCCFLLVYSLLFALLLKAQTPDYLQYYKKAEKYYNTPDATATTDSLAVVYYLRTISLLQQQHISNAILLDAYLKCGILQMTANNLPAALSCFHASISAYASAVALPDSLLFQPLLYAGSIQYSLNKPDSALDYYKQAEAISSKYSSVNELERLYNKMGVLYYETGDYQRSIPYYEKALSLAKAKKGADISLPVTYQNNIAAAYLKMRDYVAAIGIYKSLLPYHFNEDQLYSSISTAYLELDSIETALSFLHKIKTGSVAQYNNLTRAFISRRQFDSATFNNTKALAAFSSEPGNARLTDYGFALKYGGDIYDSLYHPQSALQQYQRAIIALVPGFHDTSITGNPVVFSAMQHFSLVYDLLFAKGTVFKQAKNLPAALDAYRAALALARQVERNYSSEEARLFLKDRLNKVSGEVSSLFLQLYDPAKQPGFINAAFYCVENNKASVLQTATQQLEFSGIAGLPAALIGKEQNYRAVLTRLQLQALQARDSIAIHALQKKILDTTLQLSRIQQKLEENPAYQRLKFTENRLDVDAIRAAISGKKEVVLSYYYTASQLLCFYITADRTGYTATSLPVDFFNAIRSLRKAVESPGLIDRKSEDEIEIKLYQTLLAPVQNIIRGQQHLVVIPYNEICYIPFEVLRNPQTGSDVIHDFAVSYQYSAHFLLDKQPLGNSTYKVLAIAPFATANRTGTTLPVLASSPEEIKDLQGQILVNAAATKSEFIRGSSAFPVIHLATHAIASDKNPLGSFIEFYAAPGDSDVQHRLYEKEIYNLDMHAAQLVILSACETGNGALVNGEGVISLSRAFSYAGCKSVVTSLWKADDIATAFIMKKLHVYLQKGYSKDIALQKAKLDYLQSQYIEERYKAPAYWAHLVLIGNHEPVVAAKTKWWVTIGVVVLSLLLLIFAWYKRKKAQ